MKKIIPFFIMVCCLLAVSSCSYDNFEEPKATLTGRAIYDGEAVGVRSGSSEFALLDVYKRQLLMEPLPISMVTSQLM